LPEEKSSIGFIEKSVPLMHWGGGVRGVSFFVPLMNSCIITEAAIVRMQAVIAEEFPFSQLIL